MLEQEAGADGINRQHWYCTIELIQNIKTFYK
jgi:hypothetical protein